MSIFHLAYHVDDLDRARGFYGGLLGCQEGRSTETWVDFNFFGHQISLHLGPVFATAKTGKVGDHMVPMPHLGVILPQDEWRLLADRLKHAGLAFTIAPTTPTDNAFTVRPVTIRWICNNRVYRLVRHLAHHIEAVAVV